MDLILIHVSPNDHLIIRQALLRKGLCNLQRQFRGDLSRLEGLDDVVALPAAGLLYLSFGIHHLLVLMPRIAVQVGGQYAILCLISIKDIFDCLI